MYERASTWVKRRASAAEVAAARLLSLTMCSKATPGTDAPGPELQKGTPTADRPFTGTKMNNLRTMWALIGTCHINESCAVVRSA